MQIARRSGPSVVIGTTDLVGEFQVPCGGWWRLLVKGLPTAATMSHSSWNPTGAPEFLPPTTLDVTVHASNEDKLRTDGSAKSGTLLVRLESGPHRINVSNAGGTVALSFAGE